MQTARRSCPAHPRSHGEHFDGDTVHDVGCGSSPLARGTPKGSSPRAEASRLIPARAGNTRYPSARPAARTAHPRSRGEHKATRKKNQKSIGSSPLARGAHARGRAVVPDRGLIPARAGSTRRRRLSTRAPGAHPRPCGEHLTISLSGETMLGSSPPVRGALSEVLLPTRGGGLIPARAGSTNHPTGHDLRHGAHPRPCGEHAFRRAQFWGGLGSSPPVRGARF